MENYQIYDIFIKPADPDKNFIHNIAKAFAPNKTSPVEGIKELNISKSSNNFFELHRTIPGTDLHFIHIYY